MNEFINHTNHPSARWEDGQRQAARAYGEIVDLPFPQIPADWDEGEVGALAQENADRILACRPAAVLVQGEFTYTYAIVARLKAAGIPVLSACSERCVREYTDGNGGTIKESRFVFRRFRGY